MNIEEEIQNYTHYCPDCGSCGIWGCCPYDCAKCRDEETWNGYGRAWDVRLIENKPKPPVGRKYYEHWEDMEEF